MYHIDFNRPQKVHFIGIGGISMSGLAEILINRGFRVSGSDSKESVLTDHLKDIGAEVHIGHSKENVSDDTDLLVYTAAISEDNPEMLSGREKHKTIISRAELLGEIMTNYGEAINISGTHGKTTTTSMITEVLLKAGEDPTVSVGGMLKSIKGNIRIGHEDLFVCEACEYTNSFLSFYPTISVILNVEADHLDFFKDIDDIRHSFKKFADKLPEDGLLVINSDINNLNYFTENLKARVETFGHSKDSDYTANFISYDRMARPSYTLIHKGKECGRVELGVTGEHNIYNSLAAIAVLRHLNIDMEYILKGLKEFTGTDRRFEKKGTFGNITVIDDYAHHPQEIAATIEAARKYPHRKLWILFQPHTYSRTKALLDDFAGALSQADEIVLADIYAAREKNTVGISSNDLRLHMLRQNTNVYYIPSENGDFEAIEDFLHERLKEGDLLITMGAGDIYKAGEELLEKYST